MALPSDSKERKEIPLFSGLMRYFPDALAEVAAVSFKGNEKHNPGEPLHWSRGKSNDHADCAARHLMESGTIDEDGDRHSAKLAWRSLALLQIEIEEARAKRPLGGNLSIKPGACPPKHNTWAGEERRIFLPTTKIGSAPKLPYYLNADNLWDFDRRKLEVGPVQSHSP